MNATDEFSNMERNVGDESRAKILIADDAPTNITLLTQLLSKQGYRVLVALTGDSAYETALSECPDLILLDIVMPSMDGYRVCELLKAEERSRDIPIIFLSALDESLDKVKAFKVGGVDYITKPFNAIEVLARVENHLYLRSLRVKLLEQNEKLAREIEQRKQIEASLHKSRTVLASVLNSSLDGIAALQAVRNSSAGKIEDFRCTVVNPVITQVLSQQFETSLDRLYVKTWLDGFEFGVFDALVSVVETGTPLKQDFYYETDNFRGWFHAIVVKLDDGVAITLRDITTRKIMELELNRLANLDGLTQVPNRRCFDEFLQQQWQSHAQSHKSLSLILLDVDYFKQYNDRYGHLAGDDCLKQVAQAIDVTLKRPKDFVGRYGGEEFAIVLPGSDESGAVCIAEFIQTAIAALRIPHERSQISDRLTLSFGVASGIPQPDGSPDTLILAADRALYHAKASGRNRIATYSLSNAE